MALIGGGDMSPPLLRRGRPAASAGERRDRRTAIERAAIDCLAANAFAELKVDEIAAKAGVSRRTFYRFFDSKRTLFARILQQRAVAIGLDVKRFIAGCPDFAEAIVEGSIETLRLIAQDHVFRMLVEADSKLMLDIMNVEIDTMPRSLFLSTWSDVFARGRASGTLRASISDEQAAQWLRGIHYLLTLRPDMDEAQTRALLTAFVVPSLTLREPG